MAYTKSGPSAASFDKLWAMGKPIWGKKANYYDGKTTSMDKFLKL